MKDRTKRKNRPKPDASHFQKAFSQLEAKLASEVSSFYIQNDFERTSWEVTLFERDGAVHILKFLNVWFDLPPAVFFSAVAHLDQFITRVKVQGKFLSCLTVSCFNVAAKQHHCKINPSQLVMLSQSKCTVTDMNRMSAIIKEKLCLESRDPSEHLTSFDFLTMYLDIFRNISEKLKRMCQIDNFYTKLQVLVCNSSSMLYKPSVLALALIHSELERFIAKGTHFKSIFRHDETYYMYIAMIELLRTAQGTSENYNVCFTTITELLNKYNAKQKSEHRQKLFWRFSTSTLALSKNSQNFYSPFNKVDEE